MNTSSTAFCNLTSWENYIVGPQIKKKNIKQSEILKVGQGKNNIKKKDIW